MCAWKISDDRYIIGATMNRIVFIINQCVIQLLFSVRFASLTMASSSQDRDYLRRECEISSGRIDKSQRFAFVAHKAQWNL